MEMETLFLPNSQDFPQLERTSAQSWNEKSNLLGHPEGAPEYRQFCEPSLQRRDRDSFSMTLGDEFLMTSSSMGWIYIP